MQFQIEIPDKLLVKDGVRYEVVDYRQPREGEFLLSPSGSIVASVFTFKEERYLILRPVWQWPEWLGGAAIAMDEDGQVMWYEIEPRQRGSGWIGSNVNYFTIDKVAKAVTHPFTPPPLKPGEIKRNPRYEEKP